MTTLNDIISQLQVTASINLKGMALPSVLKELLISQNIESSFFLSRVLKISLVNMDLQQVELTIYKLMHSITQITVFTTIYPHIKKSTKLLNAWKEAFIKQRAQGMFQKFNEWAAAHSPDQEIFNYFLQILVCELPLALNALYISPSQSQFESYLMWLSYFEVKTRAQHLAVCQTVKLIKDAKLVNTPDYEHKGHLMLRRVIELLGTEQRKKGSLYMLFEPGSIREKDIEYFCNVYEHLLQDLDEVYLCNIFTSLTHSGINKEVLFLIQMVSHLLHNGEQYYTLRYIYQHYILPVLANRFKSHRKIYKQIFNVVLYYVAGFLAHCKLDETAISCLAEGLQNVESQIHAQWGELALLACKDDNQLKEFARKKLSQINMSNLSQSSLSKWIEKNNKVWKVTMRNGRKLKKYPEIDSIRYKGIVNRYNDCYIISSVQALFVTQELPQMIQKIKVGRKGNTTVLDQMRRLFQSLRKKDQKATIKYLKQFGPEMFKASNNQEDVQEYLLSLFQQLQEELKQTPKGLALFQQLFKIEYSGKFICQSCGQTWKKERNEHTYIYSFRTNQVFDFQGSGKIEGYPCRKCKKEDLMEQTNIINEPKLLILHINRFSHKEGVSKKNLGNKPIKRKLGNYRLVGFISHRGANISAGHYLFYGRVGKNRWAIFDDIRVAQFTVQEQEQFQRQFRSENTPYILFYRLQNRQ